MIAVRSVAEIEMMRRAGRITAEALNEIEKHVRAGVRTEELDRIARRVIEKRGARPAFLHYRGYPATICVSVNDIVVHGIPDKRRLLDGDVVSVDVGVEYRGFYGDMAATFPVGTVSAEAARLIAVTREALRRGIEKASAGFRLFDISHAIQSYVEKQGLSVVRAFVGHGIGTQLHEEPEVPNYGMPHTGPELGAGMVLAIEPMVNAGGHGVHIAPDGWTVYTDDGGLSAHFEHTVAITKDGSAILTRC